MLFTQKSLHKLLEATDILLLAGKSFKLKVAA